MCLIITQRKDWKKAAQEGFLHFGVPSSANWCCLLAMYITKTHCLCFVYSGTLVFRKFITSFGSSKMHNASALMRGLMVMLGLPYLLHLKFAMTFCEGDHWKSASTLSRHILWSWNSGMRPPPPLPFSHPSVLNSDWMAWGSSLLSNCKCFRYFFFYPSCCFSMTWWCLFQCLFSKFILTHATRNP